MNEVDALVEEVLKEFLLDVALIGKYFAVWGPQNEVSKGEWEKRLRDREIQKRGCKTNCPRA